MHACSVVARNYLAQVRVLARSFLEHHPGSELHVLVIDDLYSEVVDEPFRTLRPWDIGFDRTTFLRLAAMYDVTELATAVKPQLLRHLLTETGGPVAYLDPDIEVFGSLLEAAEWARDHSIVLTPHVLRPMPRDGLAPSESIILKAGMYNLGFVTVSDAAFDFLDWWHERLLDDCVVDTGRGLFVDQRWIDFATVLFPHHVVRDPGWNVARWNVHERRVTEADDGFLVDGRPLRFFHFSSYDPDAPHLVTNRHGPRPRALLSEEPALRLLFDLYREQLEKHGIRETSSVPYAFDHLPNGVPLDSVMRNVYRRAVARPGSVQAKPRAVGELPADAVPNPFQATEEFLRWLGEPSRPGSPLNRYLAGVHASGNDLPRRFPRPQGRDASAFLTWLREESSQWQDIPWQVRPRESSRPVRNVSVTRRTGVNLVGYLNAEAGVGEAARLVLAGLRGASIPHSIVPYTRTPSRQDERLAARGARARFDVNLICVNADALPAFAAEAGDPFFAGARSVGLWFWELAEFPRRMARAFDFVDEVWAASGHTAEALRACSEKPVRKLPLPVTVPPRPSGFERGALGLPEDRFLFLFTFDFLSKVQRKNPAGVIEAFDRAFEPDEGPVLLVKSINGDQKLPELEELKFSASGRPDVFVSDGYVEPSRQKALIASCDAYVSLHRAEGFGLTMAEAMAYERPVIATGYSGNTEFMTSENSYLVPYELGEVPEGCPPYPAGSLWAEPDLDAAALAMRAVVDDPHAASATGRRAREDLSARHSPEVTSRWLVECLEEIRQGSVVQDA